MKSATRKPRSIKWGFIALVLFCWILPVTAISGVTLYYITEQINDQMVDTLAVSMDTALQISMNHLDSAVASSHHSSYDNSESGIKSIYNNYLRQGIELKLYTGTRAYLEHQFQYDDKVLMAMVQYSGIDDIYYIMDSVKRKYSDVEFYKTNVHNELMARAAEMKTEMGFFERDGRLYMFRNLLNNKGRTTAVLILELNKELIFQSFAGISSGSECSIWLNGTAVNIKGDVLELPEELQTGGEDYVYDKTRHMVFGKKDAPFYHIDYAVHIDDSVLNERLDGFRRMSIMIGILIVPLILLVIRFFYNNISYPMGRLMEGYAQLEAGNIGVERKERFKTREFQYLSDAFNKMSAQLKYQFDRLYMEELALRDAKIMALQSQINPHFLNNTLEIINWEARMAGNGKASRMIEALSTMLDAAMDRKGKPVVRLSEEIMYVDSYFYIIGERFGRRLTVRREIDSDVLELYVPRLIMQPIAENAVEHGVEPMQRGTVTLRAYRDEDNLYLEIENDGIMTKDDEKRIEELLSDEHPAAGESSGNIGLRNVNQRLRILYGGKAGLSIKMNRLGHSVARIIIPIDQSKQ